MDTAQWPQGIGSRPQAPPPPTTTATQSAQSSTHQQQQVVERRARPVKEQALPCPRCNSTNTKFCYYNNYSLTQPRYFCKTCRRYWTEGGSLRNVPVGGGSRKNKRHYSSTKMSSNLRATTSTVTTTITSSSSSLPFSAAKPYQGQDLNLAFSDQLMGGLNFGNSNAGSGLSAMELLRSTGIIPRGLGPLGMHMSMPEATAVYGAAGFGLHDFKFPMDGNGNGNGNGMQEGGGGGGGRLLFPFGDMKQAFQVKSNNEISDQDNREQAIFWSGTNLGGNGGSW